jgi:hypothetical protein
MCVMMRIRRFHSTRTTVFSTADATAAGLLLSRFSLFLSRFSDCTSMLSPKIRTQIRTHYELVLKLST